MPTIPTGHPIVDPLIWTVITMWVIFRASDAFETASEYIGRNLREGVRGATINAIGSSIPEVLTTLFFLLYLRDVEGFASGVGTTAGSAIFNGMVIPAAVILFVLLGGVVRRIEVSRTVLLRDGIAFLICEMLLIVIISRTQLAWYHGLLLIGIYLIYLLYLLRNLRDREKEAAARAAEAAAPPESTPTHFWRDLATLDLTALIIRGRPLRQRSAWTLLLVATAVIAVACFLLVYACERLGQELNFPVYFIAVIIAAAATSVPDTIISVKDGLRGNYDDAISNALGSNIFDICFALGFPLFLYTLFYGPILMENNIEIGELRLTLLLMTSVALLIFLIGRYMNLLKALLLLAMYIGFVLFIIGKSVDNEWALELSHRIQYLLWWMK